MEALFWQVFVPLTLSIIGGVIGTRWVQMRDKAVRDREAARRKELDRQIQEADEILGREATDKFSTAFRFKMTVIDYSFFSIFCGQEALKSQIWFLLSFVITIIQVPIAVWFALNVHLNIISFIVSIILGGCISISANVTLAQYLHWKQYSDYTSELQQTILKLTTRYVERGKQEQLAKKEATQNTPQSIPKLHDSTQP